MNQTIVEAVRASVDRTFSAFFSEKPLPAPHGPEIHSGPCIAGIISFMGEAPWSLYWILTKETSCLVARKFTGFEILFDSPDMGDLAGELVNVMAGEIVAQLEKRNVKTQMSLPATVRGRPLELVPANGTPIADLGYTSREGTFWFRLVSATNCSTRLPGTK